MKMLNLVFDKPKGSQFEILCLGAHSDDIEIGCGGTVLRLIAEYPHANFHWVVFGANDSARAAEAVASANIFLDRAGGKDIIIKGFKDGFFPYIGAGIKEYFEELKTISPDIILTHSRHDLHQDHRLMCELTWNTFRDHFIMEYEIPKYDGDMGAPNVFVHLDRAICDRKIEYILDNFKTQRGRHWFTAETFWSLLRLRGNECKAPEQYAEAFYCRKAIIT